MTALRQDELEAELAKAICYRPRRDYRHGLPRRRGAKPAVGPRVRRLRQTLIVQQQYAVWHLGLHLEDAPPKMELDRSIHIYHKEVKPHRTAELIGEPPTVDYPMSEGKIDRTFCFDP
jgi:hypothetical protein